MGLEATTLGLLAVGASAGGTLLQASALAEQGRTQRNLAEFNARVAEQEAISHQQAVRATIARKRLEDKRLLSRQISGFAAGGVSPFTGSPLEVLSQSAGILELGIQDRMRSGEITSRRLRSRAELDRLSGRAAFRGGRLQSRGTLLSGIGESAFLTRRLFPNLG